MRASRGALLGWAALVAALAIAAPAPAAAQTSDAFAGGWLDLLQEHFPTELSECDWAALKARLAVGGALAGSAVWADRACPVEHASDATLAACLLSADGRGGQTAGNLPEGHGAAAGQPDRPKNAGAAPPASGAALACVTRTTPGPAIMPRPHAPLTAHPLLVSPPGVCVPRAVHRNHRQRAQARIVAAGPQQALSAVPCPCMPLAAPTVLPSQVSAACSPSSPPCVHSPLFPAVWSALHV